MITMSANPGGRKEPSNRIWKRLSVIALSMVCLLVVQGAALAQSAVLTPGDRTFSWTAPTECVDGSAIGSSVECPDLTEHKIYCEGFANPYVVPMPETTFVAPAADFPEGSYTCYATAGNGDTESDPSNQVAFTIAVIQKPAPPALSVVADSTAYNIVEQENTLVMLPVGTVKAGTVCDAGVTAMGRYAVPRDQVTWYGNVEPLVVFADCG